VLNLSRHAFTTSLGVVFSGNDNDISPLTFLLVPASPSFVSLCSYYNHLETSYLPLLLRPSN